MECSSFHTHFLELRHVNLNWYLLFRMKDIASTQVMCVASLPILLPKYNGFILETTTLCGTSKNAGIAGTDMNLFVRANKTSFVLLSIFHNGGALNELHLPSFYVDESS